MLIISLCVIITLIFINYYLVRKILHPSVIFSIVWFLQLLGLSLFSERFIYPSFIALLIVILGVIIFSIGSHISSMYSIEKFKKYKIRRAKEKINVYLFITTVVTICVFGQYTIFNNLTQGVDLASSLVFIRTLMSVENKDIYGIFKYGGAIAISALLMLQIKILNGINNKIEKYFFMYLLIAYLIMATFSTGRGPIVLIFILMCFIYILKEGINLKIISGGLVVIILTFLIFWIMGSAMGKSDDAAGGALLGIIDYLFSSIPALSVYLENKPVEIINGDWGANTFRFFMALLASVNLVETPGNLVQESVSVPHLTNLYTAYFHYLNDFGLVGVVFFSFLIGILHGYIFKFSLTNKNDDFYLYILAISYLPLLQTIFQETHFLGISSWVQFIILGLLMTKVNSKNHESKF